MGAGWGRDEERGGGHGEGGDDGDGGVVCGSLRMHTDGGNRACGKTGSGIEWAGIDLGGCAGVCV